MGRKINILIILVIFFSLTITLLDIFIKENLTISKLLAIDNAFTIEIPAVTLSKPNYGVITEFKLLLTEGNGKVFVNIPPTGDNDFFLGFLISKQAVCKIYKNCDKYNYLFEVNDIDRAEGYSHTAGVALLYISALKNKQPYEKYPITGWILPNGLIAPVGGIEEKINASKEYLNSKLVAPIINKDTIPAFTILDLLDIYFKERPSINYTIPETYYNTSKIIAEEICSDINDELVLKYMNEKKYYSAASRCFEIKFSNESINISREKLNNEIEKLENYTKEYKCNNYLCEEIKYQILERLKMAKEINDTSQAYWRYFTAKGWAKYLNITKDIKRNDTCNIIEKDYKISLMMFGTNSYTNISCFEIRDKLSELYLMAFNKEWLNDKSLKFTEDLIFYYYTINGFSITSYNYLELAISLYERNETDKAIYYLIKSVNYAI